MRNRLDSLTGMRCPAAVIVFMAHSYGLLPEGAVRDVFDRLSRPGAVAVSYFFILSGFVLAWRHRPSDRPRAFYRRRFARIAPVYWFALVVTLPVWVAASEDGPLETLGYALPSVVALQAWSPDLKVFYGGNSVSWSLSIEVLFYALFPLLMRLPAAVWRSRWWLVALPALVVLIPFTIEMTGPSSDISQLMSHIVPVLRLPEFLAGVVLAKQLQAGRRVPVGFRAACLLTVAAYLVAAWLPIWLAWSAFCFIPLCLLIAAAAQADVDGSPSWFRGRRPVLLGNWTYAFYMLHLSVIAVIGKVDNVAPETVWTALASMVVAFLVSVGLAGLVFRYLEEPLEARLRHAPPRPETAAPVG